MIADDIIEKVAGHGQIKAAVEELVADIMSETNDVNANTATVSQEFQCEVHGQQFDVEISFKVATKKFQYNGRE